MKHNKEGIYYYTDFNTFKLILENGTLRFKESTSSNDKLDTTMFLSLFKDMASSRLSSDELQKEQEWLFHIFNRPEFQGSRVSLVACFTHKADSRLLWDAYTMHRKGRKNKRYNGVCIEFDEEKLMKAMERADSVFDKKMIHNIVYGYDLVEPIINELLKGYSKRVEELSQDENQEQDIIPPIIVPILVRRAIELRLKKCIVIPTLEILDQFDIWAPFFKHDFWIEEDEKRAVLSAKSKHQDIEKIGKYEDGSRYYDLSITSDCIKKIILGPEFSKRDANILKGISGKITFEMLDCEDSTGVGVITNK